MQFCVVVCVTKTFAERMRTDRTAISCITLPLCSHKMLIVGSTHYRVIVTIAKTGANKLAFLTDYCSSAVVMAGLYTAAIRLSVLRLCHWMQHSMDRDNAFQVPANQVAMESSAPIIFPKHGECQCFSLAFYSVGIWS